MYKLYTSQKYFSDESWFVNILTKHKIARKLQRIRDSKRIVFLKIIAIDIIVKLHAWNFIKISKEENNDSALLNEEKIPNIFVLSYVSS